MNDLLSRRCMLQGASVATLALMTRGADAAQPSRPPVLFLSHGGPIFGINDPGRIAELRAWGAHLTKPRGIVVMTPHFGSRQLELGATERGFAMYDLPPFLKQRVPRGLDYPTPPSRELAARVDAIVGTAGARAPGRPGFDHTTWMPLVCLFPQADVPVVEIAYPYRTDAALFALGRAMAPLREEGFLFLASGGMTHNLASLDIEHLTTPPPAWAADFDEWATERLRRGDADSLIDWRSKAPGNEIAHPDDGAHYRVLLVALGLALGGGGAPESVTFPVTGYESTVSRRSVQFG